MIQVFDGSLIFVTEPVSDCNVGAQSQTDEEEHYQRRLIENHCQNNPDGGNRSRSPDIPGNYCEYGTLPFSSAGAFNGQHAADMGDVARLLQL
ncbi:MAG: hypothetical protein WCF55_25210 [Pseudolabrys sp.]